MDAAEADSDVKLYKASSELLTELQGKVPLLLRTKSGSLRKWVISSKTSELMRLVRSYLDRFQEWPQLLDPVLANLVQSLVDAFLQYASTSRNAYTVQAAFCPSNVEPLPRAVCRLLYGLCKARGYKVVVRLLNNEPKYIELMVLCFRLWSKQNDGRDSSMVWEERYILLLWLSHLMLAPFELSSISIASVESAMLPRRIASCGPPPFAENLLSLAIQYLYVPSKDRESASILITRLALRGDMQRIGLPRALVSWCVEQLQHSEVGQYLEQYKTIGLFTLLFSLVQSASDSEAHPFLELTFQAVYRLATSEELHAVQIRDSAPTRKLLIKLIRSCMVHAISLSQKGVLASSEPIDVMLEGGIQLFLEWMGDSDTPVRQAVSKAIGIIALKLDTEMSAEVVVAVLESLDENVLLENIKTGQLIAATSVTPGEVNGYTRNVNAVDPLKWHGAMLALGHLLFRRSPPVDELGKIIEALLLGLRFEQRSTVGTSIGVGVRDAACFGVWSLARKYSTQEVNGVELDTAALSTYLFGADNKSSTLQTIATELVICSCLDPSGNLRRGASAALQELIGRHPDAIIEGIPIVQVVDYHAVSRRDKAVTEVAVAAASLNATYHNALLISMLDWRGIRSTDANSRESAASAIGRLFFKSPRELQKLFATKVCVQLRDLRPANVGSTAAIRHGLLMTTAEILRCNLENDGNADAIPPDLFQQLNVIVELTGNIDGRVTADLVNVIRAVATVIAIGAQFMRQRKPRQGWRNWTQQIESLLHRCTTASDQQTVTMPASEANQNVFQLMTEVQKQSLLDLWLSLSRNKKNDLLSRGRLLSLGSIYDLISTDPHFTKRCPDVISFLTDIISQHVSVEVKINAMQSVRLILTRRDRVDEAGTSLVVDAILLGLSDYTTDERGDVGSQLRLASIETTQAFIDLHQNGSQVQKLMARIVRLAAERMNKVRFEAWSRCLTSYWQTFIPSPAIVDHFEHQADTSSWMYYRQLAKLLSVSWMQTQLVLGLVSSAAAGTDDLSRACSHGILSLFNGCDHEAGKSLLSNMFKTVTEHLCLVAKSDDREVVPFIDFLSFLVEQLGYTYPDTLRQAEDTLLIALKSLQASVLSIQRTEAVVRLYSALSLQENFQHESLNQLTRKLLHKWPKVRQLAADGISMHVESDTFSSIDWNTSAGQNKTFVVDLRKELGVAGQK